MGFIRTSLHAARSSFNAYFLVILILVQFLAVGAAPSTFTDVEPVDLEPDQIMLSLETLEQQRPLSPSRITHLGEKRSWQNLQGSWGKREAVSGEYDTNQLPSLVTADDLHDYEDSTPLTYALLLNGSPRQPAYPSEQKRAWKAMNGAWGKRLSSGSDWNKFRGSWGKREPGWNNLKGLWGKRSANWNKLQSAWGKRDFSSSIPSTF